ncbi:MAG: hypothetical protein P4L43_16830 [Syntrophobacteraceae bacterium]|nr:hypothetical protein [Syntrophobacteraceae bacterium]
MNLGMLGCASLSPTYKTTRLQDYKTTRLQDYKTTRLQDYKT